MDHADLVEVDRVVTAAEIVEAIATAVAEVGIAAEMIAGDDVNQNASGGSSTRPYFCSFTLTERTADFSSLNL